MVDFDNTFEPEPTPVDAEELPRYLEDELRRISNMLEEIQRAIVELDARVSALEDA